MQYSEKDVEDLIIYLGYVGDYYYILDRQVKTEYGIIDILAYDPSDDNLVVVEIKKEIIDETAVGQIMRYLACIIDLVDYWKNNEVNELYKKIKGVKGLLVGQNANDAAKCITRCFPFLDFCKYKINTNIDMDCVQYSRVDESLKSDVDAFNKNMFAKLEEMYEEIRVPTPEELEEFLKMEKEFLEKKRAEE